MVLGDGLKLQGTHGGERKQEDERERGRVSDVRSAISGSMYFGEWPPPGSAPVYRGRRSTWQCGDMELSSARIAI